MFLCEGVCDLVGKSNSLCVVLYLEKYPVKCCRVYSCFVQYLNNLKEVMKQLIVRFCTNLSETSHNNQGQDCLPTEPSQSEAMD